MSKMSIDLAVLTETKLTNGRHSHFGFGYSVFATNASSPHHGGVAFAHRSDPQCGWHLESIQAFGPNVLSALLVSGSSRWHLVGCYIPPSDLTGTTLAHITAASLRFSHPLLLLGDLNVDLDHPQSPRDLGIAASLSSLGVFDLSTHFYRRAHRWTWSQTRNGHRLRSLCDYILGSSRSDFRNVQFKTVPNFDSDHRLVRGDLVLPHAKQHSTYVKLRRRFPFRVPTNSTRLSDRKLAFLRSKRVRPDPTDFRTTSWIAADTWHLIDLRARGKRRNILSSSRLRQLNKSIRRHIRRDRRARTATVADNIAARMAAKDLRGAYRHLKGWYRKSSGRPPKPSFSDMAALSTHFGALYSRSPPTTPLFPMHVTPFSVADDPPTPSELADALHAMRLGRSPGPTGIRTEDLRRWLMSVTTTLSHGTLCPACPGHVSRPHAPYPER